MSGGPSLRASLCIFTVAGAIAACATSGSHAGDVTRVRVIDPHQAQPLDVELQAQTASDDRVLPMTVVRVFDAIPDAYRQLGVGTVAVVDTSRGVYTIGARNLRLHGSLGGVRLSRYIDCGGAAMRTPADSYDVTFSATSYATPSGSGTTLHTLVLADARDPSANTPPVRCASTGAFERAVADAVGRSAAQ